MQRKNLTGLRVRKARKEALFTQEELARQLQLMNVNIDRVMIVKLENGTRPVSNIEIAAIAKILKADIAHEEIPISKQDWIDKLRVKLVVLDDKIQVDSMFPIEPIKKHLCSSKKGQG